MHQFRPLCRPFTPLVLALALLATAMAGFGAAMAQSNDLRIVRIVNDKPISTYDIAARLHFITATSSRAVSAEAQNAIRQQVLETLIDEQLQLQEAERLGITVSDAEIQEAVGRIERQNRMEAGQLIAMLTSRKVDANTLIDQIRATLAWRKAVSQRLSTRIAISEDDIDAYLENLQDRGGTEYLLGEIFIAANDPDQLPRARQTAERLLQQMRQGVTFTDLARQFSQAPTAGSGGDTGWVRPEQLDPALVEAINLLQPGQVTPPIAVADGYYILALRQTRKFGAAGQQETLLDLRRFFVPFSETASNNQIRQAVRRAAAAREQFNTCADVVRIATAAGDPQNGTLGEIRLGDLPSGLRPIVNQLEIGEPSPVIRLPDGALVMMLCGKRERTLGLPSREEVRENLLQREADVVARRYLRELRQNAIIQTPQDPT